MKQKSQKKRSSGKGTKKRFHSVEEILKTYVPNQAPDYSREETPDEIGRRIAEDVLEDFRSNLRLARENRES